MLTHGSKGISKWVKTLHLFVQSVDVLNHLKTLGQQVWSIVTFFVCNTSWVRFMIFLAAWDYKYNLVYPKAVRTHGWSQENFGFVDPKMVTPRRCFPKDRKLQWHNTESALHQEDLYREPVSVCDAVLRIMYPAMGLTYSLSPIARVYMSITNHWTTAVHPVMIEGNR